MMSSISGAIYAAKYQDSWAIIIGIDDYQKAANLQFAANDADGVERALFEPGCLGDRTFKLVNGEATGTKIKEALYEVARSAGSDDRVVFFFAGHGHTVPSPIGETGFLVPVEGSSDELESLLTWDELTKIGDLICAKHVLYIVDACYSGLALTRSSGGMRVRYLQDVVSRHARQVLTAGTSDQQVSDSGGPRSGHSIFTGHLLDALQGEAAGSSGHTTAKGVMQYVYDRVANDTGSEQTPQSGSLRGEGDLVFSPLDSDFSIPMTTMVPAWEGPTVRSQTELVAEAKRVIATRGSGPAEQDLLLEESEQFLEWHRTHEPWIPGANQSADSVRNLIAAYEENSKRLILVAAIFSRWGGRSAHALVMNAVERTSESLQSNFPDPALGGLQWYPISNLILSVVMGACVRGDLRLAREFLVNPQLSPGLFPIIEQRAILYHARNGILDADARGGLFKKITELERQYVPASERQLSVLQPILADIFWSGSSFETTFDEAELYGALVYFQLFGLWFPPGRFVWKYRRGGGPLAKLGEDKQWRAEVEATILDGDSQTIDGFLELAAKFPYL